MQTVSEDKETRPCPRPHGNGVADEDFAIKNGLHVEETYNNRYVDGATSCDDDGNEVDGKHRHVTDNSSTKYNGTVLQKIRDYRNGHSATTSSRSRVPLANDASDAFPFGLGSTSRNQQYAPTARAPPEFFSDTYFMGHERRGDCIIINNRKFEPHLQLNERKGSDRDATLLKFRFEELGFRVHTLVDATVKDMVEVTQYVAEVDQSNADCFIMVVLSHGDDNGIYGVDGRIVADKLYEPFKGDKCLSLAGKPKIFLTQACRGDRLDAGVDLAAEVSDKDAMEQADAVTFQRIPREADFLYSFSTVPGYYSWRNTENGSWYVQCLCHELAKHARDPAMDFVRLLTRVNRRVAMEFESNTPSISSMHKKKQVPSIVSTLTKDLILNVQNTEPNDEVPNETEVLSTQQVQMGGAINTVATSQSRQYTATSAYPNNGYYTVVKQQQQQVSYSTAVAAPRAAVSQPPKPPARRYHPQQQQRGVVVIDAGLGASSGAALNEPSSTDAPDPDSR